MKFEVPLDQLRTEPSYQPNMSFEEEERAEQAKEDALERIVLYAHANFDPIRAHVLIRFFGLDRDVPQYMAEIAADTGHEPIEIAMHLQEIYGHVGLRRLLLAMFPGVAERCGPSAWTI